MLVHILSHPAAMRAGVDVGFDKTVRILPVEDPTLETFSDFSSKRNKWCRTHVMAVTLPLDALHRSAHDLSRIVMDFGRVIPVAWTFVQTLATCAKPVIDLAPLGPDFGTDTIEGVHSRPVIDPEAAQACATFLRGLLDCSHCDSLKCNRDRQIAVFGAGQAVMCCGWPIRAAAFDLDETACARTGIPL